VPCNLHARPRLLRHAIALLPRHDASCGALEGLCCCRCTHRTLATRWPHALVADTPSCFRPGATPRFCGPAGGAPACTQHPHPHARRTSASPLLHAGDVCGRACMRACRPRQVQAVRACRRHAVVVKAWGEPVDFSAAKVVSNKSLFPGMHQIMLDVGKDVAAGYSKPGQYVQVSRSHAHGRACVVESARRLHRAADLATRPRTHAPARHTHAHTPRPRSSPTESPASSPSRPPLLTAPPSSCSSRLRRARPRATSSRSTRAAP
jgi:hypothetical protein